MVSDFRILPVTYTPMFL